VDLFLEYKGLVTQHIESSTTNWSLFLGMEVVLKRPSPNESRKSFRHELRVAPTTQDSYNHFVPLGSIWQSHEVSWSLRGCMQLGPPTWSHGLCSSTQAAFSSFQPRNVKMQQIVKATSNNVVRSESDKNWFLQYESIRVGKPSKTEDMIVTDLRRN
jgi:hypothetical protein